MSKFTITFQASVVLTCASLVPYSQAKLEFKTEILPIFEAKCVKCHKADHEENGKKIKPKGELRLDAAWAMLKGGKTKEHPALVPKSTAKSYIAEVISLPKDDDMFMPPKGDPLTAEEILKLKTWITEGADFGGWEGNLVGKPAEVPAVAKAPPKDREHDILYKKLSAGLAPATADALKKATQAGAQTSALMVASPLLHVDFLTGVSKCDDNSITGILPIKDNIAHLDLARTHVTDAAFKAIVQMPRLTRLDLRKTKVTDLGMESLSSARQLVFINLYGTEVTDAGLVALSKIKTLQNIYLTECKVTDAGVAKLKTALPKAEVVWK